jgi:Fuc2NAc and GlcNAc transferase
MNYWWFFLTAGLISLVLTAGLRRYALAKSIIDVPNARSSHSQPTPRGGGVAIVVTFVLATPVLVYLQLMTLSQAAALVGAGLLVAIVGFMDDHGHIAARWRLLGHFTAYGG